MRLNFVVYSFVLDIASTLYRPSFEYIYEFVDNKKRMSSITVILQQILQTNKYESQITQF